jgi:monofunctional biosynthetic peptidoglycan transglycosylase
MRFPFLFKQSRPRRRNRWRWVWYVVSLFVLVDGLYLYAIWPDWDALARGATPKSNFIRAYQAASADDRQLPRLRWKPVPISAIAPPMRRVVILSEDTRFYRHDGIDPEAIRDAIEYNWEKGRVVFGASTISQQTVKNLFLSSSRDPLRKWHELVLTLAMEQNLRKRRILELYLNVAEFGHGIYGVEAAARYYWGIAARDLSVDQAVSLAASLPSPKLHNPRTQTRAFQQRRSRIERHMRVLQQQETPTKTPPARAAQPISV